LQLLQKSLQTVLHEDAELAKRIQMHIYITQSRYKQVKDSIDWYSKEEDFDASPSAERKVEMYDVIPDVSIPYQRY